jgi:hypothetical protein
VGIRLETTQKPFKVSIPTDVQVPSNRNELAYYSISQLAALLQAQKITSLKLTQFYLDRLKKYGPGLECVITLTVAGTFQVRQNPYTHQPDWSSVRSSTQWLYTSGYTCQYYLHQQFIRRS